MNLVSMTVKGFCFSSLFMHNIFNCLILYNNNNVYM